MNICFVVRSLHSQHPSYTTTHLAYSAWQLKHEVYYTTINHLSINDDDQILANTWTCSGSQATDRISFLNDLKKEPNPGHELNLARMDIVFFRFNPNETEIDKEKNKTFVVEFGRLLKEKGVWVINDPDGVSKAQSKLYLNYLEPSIRPRTLVTRSLSQAKHFLNNLGRPAILKPVSGFGGQDVFFIRNAEDELNINQILSTVSKGGYLLVQEYLPQVKFGDKRLLLYRGEPIRIRNSIAIYNRISPRDDIRSNMHVGGRRSAVPYTDVEAHIVEKIKPQLIRDRLDFVGIDIVGDKLLEINVFCPGGIHNINELCQIDVGQWLIQQLETDRQQLV